MIKVLYNGRVITDSKIIEMGGLKIRDDQIICVFEGEYDTESDSGTELDLETEPDSGTESDSGTEIEFNDCKGNYISPGFIDIHVHGGNGGNLNDASSKSLEKMISFHANHGTTTLLPTSYSSSFDNLISSLDNLTLFRRQNKLGVYIAGAHLEGNYFSMKQKGAQNPEFIISPRKEEYEEILKHAEIKIISAAPEIENGLEFGREMAKKGIVMSIGHSDASFKEAVLAFENGYSHITHIYNGNSWLRNPYYYLQIGVCEAGLLYDEVTIEAIADGKHLPPEMLKLLYKIKGADKMHVVTDASGLAGLPEGEGVLGGLPVIVEDDVAKLVDRSSFAGSVATTEKLLRVLYKKAEIPMLDAVKMLSSTPARVIGEHRRIGMLTVGYQADINVFDEEINILATFKNGETVFNKLKK